MTLINFTHAETHENKELEVALNALAALVDGLENMVFEGDPEVDSLTVAETLDVAGASTFDGAVAANDDFAAAGSAGSLIETDASADKIAFFGATLAVQPEVTGARDETEGALASLLTALDTLGLIVDSSTES